MNKDMELLSKLTRVERALHKEQIRLHREGHFFVDTSRGQGRILAMLKIKDGISTKALSYLLEIRVSSLNETLAKMEKNGYINRQPSADDKRVSVIYLTEKGRSKVAGQVETPSIFNCFSDDEKEIFSEYLDRLLAELESRNDSEDPRRNIDGKWMETMKGIMGEEWYEHVIAMHNGKRPFSQEENEELIERMRDSFGEEWYKYAMAHRHGKDPFGKQEENDES